ncbi:helix-turn-helix domain-containing protein [Enterovibrio paralichthyis]|uniref:helix-turn-helix domain-containing protein n=1 Tax=Enterovibrio paralichthyis TaxID=2853805 RepID=UPI001C45F0F4|nr:helix-turn-helix domain-containing protein [Enterovibrio paralichthyis]MBV7297369.1 helix-turn-helix domain-containing protein [Enterovibrio paralichthyis]
MPNLNVEFNMITLGLAIRAKRTQLTWRIEDLAEKADLSRRTIMRMEKGDANVTLSNLLTVLDLLGLSLKIVDIAALLGSSNKKLKTKLAEEDGWYE